MNRKPDFENLLRVLDKKAPKRPTLFEFFLNPPLYRELAGTDEVPDEFAYVRGFLHAGYDYCTVKLSGDLFPRAEIDHAESYSMNDGALIKDWESFRAYSFGDPDKLFMHDHYEGALRYMEPGVKAIAYGPCGLMENLVALVGFDNLCFMAFDAPDLLKAVTDAIGSRLLRYYEISAALPGIGAGIINDDWGFNSQTMMMPEDMRKYIIPWHAKMVEAFHRNNKPAILHSCGNLAEVYDDIINICKFDGKHSYEDKIEPVEEAYEALNGKIAVLGGIDLDFVCRKTPVEIRERCLAMLKRAETRGGYALGTGNSVPEYVPHENYYAMIDCVRRG